MRTPYRDIWRSETQPKNLVVHILHARNVQLSQFYHDQKTLLQYKISRVDNFIIKPIPLIQF